MPIIVCRAGGGAWTTRGALDAGGGGRGTLAGPAAVFFPSPSNTSSGDPLFVSAIDRRLLGLGRC